MPQIDSRLLLAVGPLFGLSACSSVLGIAEFSVTDAGHDSGESRAPDGGGRSGQESGPSGDANSAQGCMVGEALGTIGCPCSTSGSLACNGHAQKTSLICSKGIWALNQTCPSGQLCDTATGRGQGTCLPIDPLCSGADAGQEVCSGSTVVACGVDLLTDSLVHACAQPTPTCSAGACSCPTGSAVVNGACCSGGQVGCSGACVDEQTDNANCGGCGLACSTMCTAGRCLVTLATGGEINPTGIALDATTVYWTSYDVSGSGVVIMVPLSGGATTTLASQSFPDPRGVGVEGASVYWVDDSQTGSGSAVMAANLDGSMLRTLVPGLGAPVAIAVDATSVYWADQMTGAVVKVSQSGGNPVTLATGGVSNTLALDDTSVYWYRIGVGVMRVSLGGGTAATLTTSGSDSMEGYQGLAVSGSTVYWADPGAGTVSAVSTDGGAATTLASNLNGPTYIAVDGTQIYWTNSINAGTVMAVPVDGGTPTTLAAGLANPGPITVDSTSLYWAEGDGTLKKLTPK